MDRDGARTTEQKRQFDDKILQQLMFLNPQETQARLKSIEDSKRLEHFHNFCKANKLKFGNYTAVHSVDQLNFNMSIIHHAIKAVLRSSQYLTLLSKRLITAVRNVQRFVRTQMKHHRDKKEELLTMWRKHEMDARTVLRADIEQRARQLKSSSAPKQIEEMWGVYLDCWVPEDRMRRAIDSCWRERRNTYVERFRDWKKRGISDLKLTGRETETKRRNLISRMTLAFDFMNFRAKQVTMMELCAHDHLLQVRNILFNLKKSDRMADAPIPRNVGDPSKLVAPISFYHQLITYKPKLIHLCVFLKQIGTPEGIKLPPGAAASVRRQAQEAKELYVRWNRPILREEDVDTFMGNRVRQRGKRHIGDTHIMGGDGQPISGLSQYNSPVASRRASLSPSLRRQSFLFDQKEMHAVQRSLSMSLSMSQLKKSPTAAAGTPKANLGDVSYSPPPALMEGYGDEVHDSEDGDSISSSRQPSPQPTFGAARRSASVQFTLPGEDDSPTGNLRRGPSGLNANPIFRRDDADNSFARSTSPLLLPRPLATSSPRNRDGSPPISPRRRRDSSGSSSGRRGSLGASDKGGGQPGSNGTSPHRGPRLSVVQEIRAKHREEFEEEAEQHWKKMYAEFQSSLPQRHAPSEFQLRLDQQKRDEQRKAASSSPAPTTPRRKTVSGTPRTSARRPSTARTAGPKYSPQARRPSMPTSARPLLKSPRTSISGGRPVSPPNTNMADMFHGDGYRTPRRPQSSGRRVVGRAPVSEVGSPMGDDDLGSGPLVVTRRLKPNEVMRWSSAQ